MKPLNTTDFHTDTDEVPHAQLANLAAMARSIFHQVGATEVAHPELTTLVNFNVTNGVEPAGSLIADANGAYKCPVFQRQRRHITAWALSSMMPKAVHGAPFGLHGRAGTDYQCFNFSRYY